MNHLSYSFSHEDCWAVNWQDLALNVEWLKKCNCNCWKSYRPVILYISILLVASLSENWWYIICVCPLSVCASVFVCVCVCVCVTPPLWAPHAAAAAAAAAAWAWLNRFSTDCLLHHCRCKKRQSSIIPVISVEWGCKRVWTFSGHNNMCLKSFTWRVHRHQIWPLEPTLNGSPFFNRAKCKLRLSQGNLLKETELLTT